MNPTKEEVISAARLYAKGYTDLGTSVCIVFDAQSLEQFAVYMYNKGIAQGVYRAVDAVVKGEKK